MCRDFKESSLMNTYNIEWIKNNVEHNLINKKVPFLTAIVKQIKHTSKSPIFVLADPTGMCNFSKFLFFFNFLS